MSILIVHLSDAHLRTPTDSLVGRTTALAMAISHEMDVTVRECVLAFTGDATDKGYKPGFQVAKQFLASLVKEVRRLTNVMPILFVTPGNHDVVEPDDSSLRDAAIASLSGEQALCRPKKALESVILGALDEYFAFADTVAPGATPNAAHPYYVAIDKILDGKRIRFHLLNSSWMCKRKQGANSLLFPIEEIKVPDNGRPDYELTLLHHPFPWFKQPEAMRPLRDAVEGMSDMILTGHEHVGRLMTTTVHNTGSANYEYLEAEALQEGNQGERSGFHVLRLDFQSERQGLITFRWEQHEPPGAYVRAVGPIESPLGRNRRKAAQAFRLRKTFDEALDDPELPVLHSKNGKLRLSDFYTYPDLGRMKDSPDNSKQRIRGEGVLTLVAETPKILLLGGDRCGKTSLAKRLYADLHRRGDVPLLLLGERLKNTSPAMLGRMLESCVKDQYELLASEAYWQVPSEKRVLILDDLHDGPIDRQRREQLLVELARQFTRIVIIAPEEYGFDELFSYTEEAGRGQNSLWTYEAYKILPFGYVACDRFVRKWVSLDQSQLPDQLEEKVRHINGLLIQFLRSNPIPQYPWVVLVIVQQGDSPEPLHAENGSYGYLLQALITAALTKSKLKLPVPGKYRWLGELANELYTRNVGSLLDADARQLHQGYCRDYGVMDIEYKEMRDDLAGADVLRVEDGAVSFRQPYTYCFFVAWHLANRINANDPAATEEVKNLCQDLYHEDTANVLVFLASLTAAPAVLDEMKKTARGLFARYKETDFDKDVDTLNNLYQKVQAFVLPQSDPKQNQLALHDGTDDKRAERASKAPPKREVILRPNNEIAKQDSALQDIMEIVTTLRTIEILGQVLRNEATARKVPAMIEIAEEIFRLGRRLLGFLFVLTGVRLERVVGALEGLYRQRFPKASDDELVDEVSRHIFNMYLFAAFAVVKHVALAVGERNLHEVFRQLVATDPNLANRIYKLAIDLETAGGVPPLKAAELLNDELAGDIKGEQSLKRVFNNFAQTLVRTLVVDYLHLNYVPQPQMQALCKKLHIKLPASVSDHSVKRLPPPSKKSRPRKK